MGEEAFCPREAPPLAKPKDKAKKNIPHIKQIKYCHGNKQCHFALLTSQTLGKHSKDRSIYNM